MSEKKEFKDLFYWTNGDDYLFSASWIGEWNVTKIKEDKNKNVRS